MQVLSEDVRDCDLLLEAGPHADHRDPTADLRGFDRLLQGVLAAYFDDMVDAAARPIRDRLSPFGNRAIVYRMICSELLRPLALFVA